MSGQQRILNSIHENDVAARQRRPKPAASPDVEEMAQDNAAAALQRVITHPERATPGDILALQHTAGNQAVQRFLQRSASHGAVPEEDIGGRIQAAAGRGNGLDSAVQSQLERGLGASLSGVRVHTDSEADHLSRSVDALAFTSGRDIFFRSGAYNPGSTSGLRLLAHEAAHVVQQAAGPVAGTPAPGGVTISHPADSFEQAADRVADAFISGAAVGAQEVLAPAPAGVQRQAVRDEGDLDDDLALQRCDCGGGAMEPDHQDEPALSADAPAVQRQGGGGGGGSTLPTVTLGNFRNSGSTHSENNCPLCPKTLGIDSSSGQNVMEIRGTVTGHVTGAVYDIKRTKERGTWKKVGGTWTQLTHVGPDADDDSHNSDEDLTPENDHIYVIDTPGFRSNTDPVGDASAEEAVYKASFVESCNVSVGGGTPTKSSNELAWHSISWFEKVGGSWQRKAGSNEIATGSTTVGTGNP